ncbi:palmitoyl-protein thioesterase 1-like [Culicoides brevitarsis]|uniref:palmitoyl-protein thioesterase 1-like n=1 Tax=Culicoides brevitarsis TaxID=469753 RepID=UPI00307BD32A
MSLVKILNFIAILGFVKAQVLPVVLWHGMGDTCCSPNSLGRFKTMLEEEMPGVYVLSLKITGDSKNGDIDSSFFIHPTEQVREACNIIANDTQLQTGFNGIGFSQGGLFFRALQQQCSTLKMINLITLGSPHQGVFGLPNCEDKNRCSFFRSLLNHGAYYGWVQKLLVQATYWHDPLHEDKYRKYSTFLADVNNENEINEVYVKRLKSLNKLVLVKFGNDSIVKPRESQWFGYYRPGQDKELLTMEEMPLYQEDRLGLKAMKESGQLVMLETPGNHLEYSRIWFYENILPILAENSTKNDLK